MKRFSGGLWGLAGMMAVVGCGSEGGDSTWKECLRDDVMRDGSLPALPENAAEVQAECLDAGLAERDCSPANFIDQFQADCIANTFNPPSGERRTGLVFAAVTRRPIWNVRIQLSGGRAQHYAIDAITGELLRRHVTTSEA